MNKRIKSTFSWILVISILLSVMPNTAWATGTESDEVASNVTAQTPSVDLQVPELTESEPTILEEDVSLRGEYEKHFLMSDGSYQVALYHEPIHAMQDGQWVEIDNTLSLRTAADGTARYTTANGHADVSFSKSFDDQLVTMQQGEYSLAWGVQAVSNSISMSASVQPIQAELVAENASLLSTEEQKTLVAKASSAIQYRNALRQDVDLEYIVLPSRVKENIILQSPQDISGYVVTVYTENLSARLLENREIQFFNSSNEVIFTMTSPYMYDSAGELSENIAVELISKGTDCHYIAITPDAQWLSDENRVYPVVIDPQVTTDTTRTNIIDNYVLQGAGNQNRNLDRLYIGNRPEGLTRAFIKFATMPTLPEGATITNATMTVWLTSGSDTGYTANAYQVTGGDWTSGTITWANQPAANTLLASNISHNNFTKYSFSCLSAVQSWYNGSTTGQNANYGIMVRYTSETPNDYNAFYSADYTEESKRPSVLMTYNKLVDGIYRITSKFSGFSIGANGNISNNTTVVTQAHYTSSPQNMIQLWKITYLGGGMYSVRPVFAPDMALSATENGICIQEIGIFNTLSDVPASARWTISYNGSSYRFFNNGSSQSSMMLSSTSISPGIRLTTGSYSENSALFQWNIAQGDTPEYGAWIYDTSTKQFSSWSEKIVVYGETKTLAGLNLIPTVFSASSVTRRFQWTTSDSSIVSVNADIGKVSGVSGGRAVITGTTVLGSTKYSVNMTVYSTLPMSGSELDYEPSLWSGTVESNCNCYAYAINNQVIPGTNTLWYKQQPGLYSYTDTTGYGLNPSKIVTAVQEDYATYNYQYGTNYVFTPIGRYETCPAGTYKVALVVGEFADGQYDYHWYRQDSDGLWSHKRGTYPVQRTDNSGQKIADPATADRGFYTVFVGYYAVTPWNNLYAASGTYNITSNYSADLDNDVLPIVDANQIALIQNGMTLEEVVGMLQAEGNDIGSGTVIHQYQTQNGVATIAYHMDLDRIYRVTQISFAEE